LRPSFTKPPGTRAPRLNGSNRVTATGSSPDNRATNHQRARSSCARTETLELVGVIDLPAERVVEMTPPELAAHVLRDLVATGEWSSWNYINEAQRGRYRGAGANAISGAIAWLQGQGLIAQDPRQGGTWTAIVVTPAGHAVAARR
jgi:hypothetical protein